MHAFDSSDPSVRYFVAIGRNYYGVGRNAEEALANRRRAGGKGPRRDVHVLICPLGATGIFVNDHGEICWNGAKGRLEFAS